MNAPVLHLAIDGSTPPLPTASLHATVGFGLFTLAMRGGIALSDRYGCWTAMSSGHPSPLARADREGAHRVAIDLVQGHARRLDAVCRAVLARAEQVAEHATGDEAHAALADISDLIATALVGDEAPS